MHEAVPLRVWRRKPHGEVEAIDYVFGLLDITWWYYAIAAILATVVCWKWRWEGSLLAGYTFLILVETVLIRKPFEGQHLNLELLWPWRVWYAQKEQILTNVVMSVPVGVLAGRLCRWKGSLVASGLSLVIELLQLITARGLCEFNDVLHNMFSAVIGIGIVMVMQAGKKLR